MARRPSVRQYMVTEEFVCTTSYLVMASSKANAIQIVHDDYEHEVSEVTENSDVAPTGRWWARRMNWDGPK